MLYAAPDEQAGLTARVAAETPVTIFGRTQAGDWVRVRLPTRAGGWMAVRGLMINVDVMEIAVVGE